MDHYAVFGHPISHSQSPFIHTEFARESEQTMDYVAQDVDADQFHQALADFRQAGGRGVNCTVPLKELAFQAADQLSERVKLCGAANTLVLNADGSIYADNTDGAGLLRDLKHNLQIPLHKQRLLILGAGGATRGILEPLLQEQPSQLLIANRTAEKATTLAQQFSHLGALSGCGLDEITGSFDLILNATAASLSNQLPALPEAVLAESGSCYDLAYAKQATPFVQWGLQQGAKQSVDGIGMLVEQAAEAFLIWRGVRPNTAQVIKQLEQQRQF